MAVLNAKGTLMAGVLAAIGASVCCVGPLVLLALGIGGPADRQATATYLLVQNMTCELCPITVKKALDKVPGVAATKIDLAKKTAKLSGR